MNTDFDNCIPAEEFKKARRGKASLAVASMEDRLPPHSIEAEQGVLGCILLSPVECLSTCIEKLKAGSLVFYDLRHKEIYGALIQMQDAGQSIDLITLQQFLKDRQQLEPVGGLAYLASLPDAVPSAANLAYYLEIVREKFTLRKMIGLCTEIVLRAYDHQGEVDKLMDQVEQDLSKLTETEAEASEVHIRHVMQKIIPVLEKHYSRGSMQLDGLPTGPPGNYFDKLIGGIKPTDYVVLGGRPGSFKTTAAMNVVEHLANDYVWWEETGEFHPLAEGEDQPKPVMREKKGVPVCVFSIEMTAESLGMRMLFARAKVDMAQWKQGFRHAGDDVKLTKALAELAKSNIYIDDCSTQTIGQIAAKARRMARQHGIKLFVLDYVQLVDHDGGNGDRQRELTKISRKIMALKKQLKVPWIVLAQMNRDIEKAERERKPVMSDLKDCGALEQDCDILMFTYKTPRAEVQRRPGSSKGNPEGDGPSDEEIIATVAAKEKWAWSMTPFRVDFIVVKNREGATGEAHLVALKNLGRVVDWHQWKVKHGVEDTKQGEARVRGEEVL